VRWRQRQQAEKVAAAWPSVEGRRRGSGPHLGRKGEVSRLSHHLDWKERWAELDRNGPDEAGLVREERWTRLQESLCQNRFGPPEK
jgi:hypothetical protein